MIDMQGIAAEKIRSMEESGQIKERIEKKVEELVLRSIDDAIGNWEHKRQITDKLTAEVSNVLGKVDFTTYNGIIAEKAREVIDGTLRADIANKVQASLELLFVKKYDGIKLSEIITAYQDYLNYLDDSDKDELGNQFYLSIREPMYSFGADALRVTLALDETKEEDRYEFSIQKNKDKSSGKLTGLRVEGRMATNQLHVGYISSFQALLLNLYYNDTPIMLDVIDANEIDTSLGLDD